jgi:hypothetical protein
MLLLISTTAFLVSNHLVSENNETTQFYVGVTFCGNTTMEAKLLINRVKNYTNLFVLQSGPISKNETATNEICDYAAAAGLHIIVYFGWFDPDYPWQLPWLDLATQRWGDRFLGVYYYDEPGGIQIDYNWSRLFDWIKRWNSTWYENHLPAIEGNVNGSQIQLYDEAAKMYVSAVEADPGLNALKTRSITAFTSDYALYWFDYLGGYDVVLSQFGRNVSLVQSIALIRGAARMQNKTWGAIITWKYDAPPYLESGEEIYEQMRMAYEAGATYVMIFNYPKINDNPYGIMLDEHFEALERFWNDLTAMPKKMQGSVKAEAAFVLPRNYGWGMRYPEDRIWGFWGPDEKSPQIWELTRNLLAQYDLRLDIVYDDPTFPVIIRRLPIWLTTAKYPRIYYWNHSM